METSLESHIAKIAPDSLTIKNLKVILSGTKKKSLQSTLVYWLICYWLRLTQALEILSDNIDYRLLEITDTRKLTGDNLISEVRKRYES
jgi:hypothetical protein